MMNFDPLPREFYDRDVVEVAQQLLGKLLVRRTPAATCMGRIVEVEAYLAEDDRACHAYGGLSRKNRTMFGLPGRLYVYPIHGRYCMNAVTQPPGIASAVLIRAIEPLAGISFMQQRRGIDRLLDLARGPARLCEALQVDRRLDGWDLARGARIWISCDESPPSRMGVSPRIGVTSNRDARLRFFVDRSPYVSGPRRFHSTAADRPKRN